MSSEKQIAANRLNALKGGVKTPEGKAVSRMNALKHGLFARAFSDSFDTQEIRPIHDKLLADLRPIGTVEEMIVESLAVTWLQMERCAREESRYQAALFAEQPTEVFTVYYKYIVTLGKHEVRLSNQFLRLLRELEYRQQLRSQPSQPSGPRPRRNLGSFLKLHRARPPRQSQRPSPESAPSAAADISTTNPQDRRKPDDNLVSFNLQSPIFNPSRACGTIAAKPRPVPPCPSAVANSQNEPNPPHPHNSHDSQNSHDSHSSRAEPARRTERPSPLADTPAKMKNEPNLPVPNATTPAPASAMTRASP